MDDFKKFDYSILNFDGFSTNSIPKVNKDKPETPSSQSSEIKNKNIEQYIPNKIDILKFIFCAMVFCILIVITIILAFLVIEILIIAEIFVKKIFFNIVGLGSFFALIIKSVKKIKEILEIKNTISKDWHNALINKLNNKENVNIKKFILTYIVIVILVSVLLFNTSFFYSLAKERVETNSNYILSHLEDKEEIIDEDEMNYSDTYDEKNTDYKNYTNEMSFKLSDDPINSNIDKNLYNNVFPVSINESIWEYSNSIHGTLSSNYHKQSFASDIQNGEDYFLEKIQLAREYKISNGQNETWWNKMPQEEELLAIIDAEEEFSLIHKNFFVYNRISNLYQKLGLEYVVQKKDKEIAKYYYMKSIEYDFLSIKYSNKTIDYDYNTAVERLYKRYNDIVVYCIEDENSYEAEILYSYINDLKLHIV